MTYLWKYNQRSICMTQFNMKFYLEVTIYLKSTVLHLLLLSPHYPINSLQIYKYYTIIDHDKNHYHILNKF